MKLKYCAMTWFPGREKLSVYVSSVPNIVRMLTLEWQTAEIMKFEFKIFGKLFLITKDNPSKTSVDKTIFVTGAIISYDDTGNTYWCSLHGEYRSQILHLELQRDRALLHLLHRRELEYQIQFLLDIYRGDPRLPGQVHSGQYRSNQE